jgi:hypothetical protein
MEIKTLRTIRNLTQLNIFNPSPTKTPQHLRLFTTTTTTTSRTRQPSHQYPDEETRIARYKDQAECHRIRYQNDPAYRAYHQQKQQARYANTKSDDNERLRVLLSNCVRRIEWVREQLPWKSHQPVLFENKQKHYCYGCDWVRSNGMKIWWRKRGGDEQVREDGEGKQQMREDGDDGDVEKSDKFLCHGCYVNKRTLFEVLPEGYEDVRTLKELVARKKQLDTRSSDTSNQ